MNTRRQDDDPSEFSAKLRIIGVKTDEALAQFGIGPDTPIKMFNNRPYRSLTWPEKVELLAEKAANNPSGPSLASCKRDVIEELNYANEKRYLTEKLQMNATQANKDAAKKWKTYADNNHERFNDKTSLDTAEELIAEMEKRNDAKKEYMERDKESLKKALEEAKDAEEVRKILEQYNSNAQARGALPFPRIPKPETIAARIATLRRRPIN